MNRELFRKIEFFFKNGIHWSVLLILIATIIWGLFPIGYAYLPTPLLDSTTGEPSVSQEHSYLILSIRCISAVFTLSFIALFLLAKLDSRSTGLSFRFIRDNLFYYLAMAILFCIARVFEAVVFEMKNFITFAIIFPVALAPLTEIILLRWIIYPVFQLLFKTNQSVKTIISELQAQTDEPSNPFVWIRHSLLALVILFFLLAKLGEKIFEIWNDSVMALFYVCLAATTLALYFNMIGLVGKNYLRYLNDKNEKSESNDSRVKLFHSSLEYILIFSLSSLIFIGFYLLKTAMPLEENIKFIKKLFDPDDMWKTLFSIVFIFGIGGTAIAYFIEKFAVLKYDEYAEKEHVPITGSSWAVLATAIDPIVAIILVVVFGTWLNTTYGFKFEKVEKASLAYIPLLLMLIILFARFLETVRYFFNAKLKMIIRRVMREAPISDKSLTELALAVYSEYRTAIIAAYNTRSRDKSDRIRPIAAPSHIISSALHNNFIYAICSVYKIDKGKLFFGDDNILKDLLWQKLCSRVEGDNKVKILNLEEISRAQAKQISEVYKEVGKCADDDFLFAIYGASKNDMDGSVNELLNKIDGIINMEFNKNTICCISADSDNNWRPTWFTEFIKFSNDIPSDNFNLIMIDEKANDKIKMEGMKAPLNQKVLFFRKDLTLKSHLEEGEEYDIVIHSGLQPESFKEQCIVKMLDNLKLQYEPPHILIIEDIKEDYEKTKSAITSFIPKADISSLYEFQHKNLQNSLNKEKVLQDITEKMKDKNIILVDIQLNTGIWATANHDKTYMGIDIYKDLKVFPNIGLFINSGLSDSNIPDLDGIGKDRVVYKGRDDRPDGPLEIKYKLCDFIIKNGKDSVFDKALLQYYAKNQGELSEYKKLAFVDIFGRAIYLYGDIEKTFKNLEGIICNFEESVATEWEKIFSAKEFQHSKIRE